MNEIEYMLKLDNQTKRKIGSGVFHRASRKGFIRGGIKTQSDYLTKKEKKKLNGDVIVSNMYSELENVPSLEDLQAMDKKDASNIMKIIMNFHSKAKIAKHWKVSQSKLYNFLVKVNLYEKIDGKYIKIDGNTAKPRNYKKQPQKATETTPKDVTTQKATTEEPCGFKIEFNNTVGYEEAESRLLAFSTILNKDKKYIMRVVMTEID